MKFRWLFQCYFIQFVMILFYILTISLTFPFFFARQKQFGTFGKKNIGLKNTKVAWGSRPWRAERRKCSSQIMFGSLNSISTLAKMLLMMMSVIIFGTKTYNNTSHWMIYDSVTPSTFLDKLTTSNQVINCNEVNLRVRERHRIIFALLSLIIMKESNHFYIYTLGRGANNQNGNLRWYLPWRAGSRGGLECHIPILKNESFENHSESFTDCENVFCT